MLTALIASLLAGAPDAGAARTVARLHVVVALGAQEPGQVDPRLEHFHGHLAHAGLTYSTMSVLAEKATPAEVGAAVTAEVSAGRTATVTVDEVKQRSATLGIVTQAGAEEERHTVACGRSVLIELGPAAEHRGGQLLLVVDYECAKR